MSRKRSIALVHPHLRGEYDDIGNLPMSKPAPPHTRGEYFILGAVTATKMNEAELIKEIVAEEARRRQEATFPEKGQKGFQSNVPQTFAEHLRAPETAATVASQVGLGSKETYRKAEKVWNKAKSGNEKAKQAVKALDKDEVVPFLASIPG